MYDVAYVGVRTNHIRLGSYSVVCLCVGNARLIYRVCVIYIIYYTHIYAPREMTLTLNMVKYDVMYTSSGNVCCIGILSCS
jgi:hypothetical protein